MQIIERLLRALGKCEADLADKDVFLDTIGKLEDYVTQRNNVADAVCRYYGRKDLLVFAHANETAGVVEIKTGDDIAFFIIPVANFVADVGQLTLIDHQLQEFAQLWLPRLRPWLN